MRKTISKMATKVRGKNFEIDSSIPTSYLLNLSATYLVSLARGLLILRRKVFLSRSCEFRCKNRIRIGSYSKIGNNCYFDALSKKGIIIGESSSIGPYTRIECSGTIRDIGKGLVAGNNLGVGAFSFFGCAGGVEIGNNVIMGQYISFHSENHIFSDPNVSIKDQGVTRSGIKIGSNVWVGSKVTFLDGCQVSDNSVVAAGAVVNSVFPEGVIIGGIPAKIIRKI